MYQATITKCLFLK